MDVGMDLTFGARIAGQSTSLIKATASITGTAVGIADIASGADAGRLLKNRRNWAAPEVVPPRRRANGSRRGKLLSIPFGNGRVKK